MNIDLLFSSDAHQLPFLILIVILITILPLSNRFFDCALSLVVKLYVRYQHIKLDYQSKGTSLSLHHGEMDTQNLRLTQLGLDGGVNYRWSLTGDGGCCCQESRLLRKTVNNGRINNYQIGYSRNAVFSRPSAVAEKVENTF